MLGRIIRSYLYVFRHYPALIGMGIIVIIVQLGWSEVIAITPLYFKNHLHQKGMIGLVLLAFLGVETALKPSLGHLGDRVGRKPMIIGGCLAAISAVGLMYFPDKHNWYWFFPLMALNGAAAAAVWPAVSAYMGERVPAADKAAAMSVFEGGYLIGFGVGGAAGLFLGGKYGNEDVFLIASGTFALALVLTVFVVHGGHYHDGVDSTGAPAPSSDVHTLSSGAVSLLRELPMLFRLMFVYVMSQFATTALAPIVTLYGEQELGRTQEEMAELFIGPAIVIAMVGVAMGRVADKMGKARAILACYAIAATCLFSLYLARAPQPGVIEKVSAGTVVVSRKQVHDVLPGDVLSVRREGKQIAWIEVRQIGKGGFAAEIQNDESDAGVVPGDRVFIRAKTWQIAFMVFGLTLLLIAYALGAPALLGLASAVSPRRRQGQALGLMNAAQGVGSCLGMATGPLLYDHVSPQAPVLMACAMYVFCVAFSLFFVHEPHEERKVLGEGAEAETDTTLSQQAAGVGGEKGEGS